MSATIAEIDLPANKFAPSQTLSEMADVTFEVERFVAHDTEHIMPFVWITGDDNEQINEALSIDPSIDSFRMLADLDGEWLYQMDWIDQIETLVQILIKEDGTILAAFGDASGWRLRVLFPERDSLSRTYDYCREADLSLDIRSIYQPDKGREGRFGLTDEQHDTIVNAYEQGYFNVPRDITFSDLADELGISHQALSERLRRGEKNVLENTVIVGGGENVESS